MAENQSYMLENYFKEYNRKFQGLSESSIIHYCDAIRKISRILRENHQISESLYEIRDLDRLDEIRRFLDVDQEYQSLDNRGHHMYSCGFKKYYEFASASEFKNIGEQISAFDEVTAQLEYKPQKQASIISTYKRSSILKLQVVQAANYKCELNPGHKTFTAQSSLQPYMEAHHIIPLNRQNEFTRNLDIYANVICLCPICHRLLHYGVEKERRPVLDSIFIRREKRLQQSGVPLSRSDFLELTLGG